MFDSYAPAAVGSEAPAPEDTDIVVRRTYVVLSPGTRGLFKFHQDRRCGDAELALRMSAVEWIR